MPRTEQEYKAAREIYAELAIDTDQAIETLASIPLSIHCWQGDDVIGFDGATSLSGGILSTGSYPGRARNAEELRSDAAFAFSLIPGKKRFNLHAMYAETGGAKVDRCDLEPSYYEGWIEWAKQQHIGLDFNPTFFSHPLAESGWTLAHADNNIRDFWIRHGKASRRIAQSIADALKDHVVNNLWVPDGYKDMPADRLGPRLRLKESLDAIYSEKLPNDRVLDSVESKLFGIGSEAYVAGSHEFYLGYASQKAIGLCYDMGHFHPTENVADKISSTLLYVPYLILHLSRGLRWDSDHIVIWNDSLTDVCREIVRMHVWDRVHLALDYFDSSVNRISAWINGARSTQRALLYAFLEPLEPMRAAEEQADFGTRLSYIEESGSLPFGAIWHHYCETQNVPYSLGWLEDVKDYEKRVLAKRM
ncbi:MAG TPA: L-rhamnose isomerase [Rectinema sp.]|nr:L-rhamnose isomerase [Rectinema sp.]HPK80025.1 L-rhamnose isomerase [Rectinema sp.]